MIIPFRTAVMLSNILIFSSLGIYLNYRAEILFSHLNISRFNQRRLAISCIFLCFYMALMLYYPCFNDFRTFAGYVGCAGLHLLRSSFFVFLPVFVIMYVERWLEGRNVTFLKKHLTVTLLIFIFLTSTNIWMALLIPAAERPATVTYTFLVSLLFSGIVTAIYLNLSYANLAEKRLRFERELEISRLNEQKTKAELEALQAKVNPHFLYNTLNSIAELSLHQGAKARQMTIALAGLFRYSLNKKNETLIAMEDEIEMVENYLMIEKIRFEDKLDVSIEVDEAVKRMMVPKFILQPLVENAVKHGLKKPDKKGVIRVVIRRNAGRIDVAIYDNGAPFPEDIQIGYGLKSVMDKLSMFFPGEHTIYFENNPFKQVSISMKDMLSHA
ncbi:MAG: histidine kinase [Bacteroidota bacterium]|nr:histidine kinase [Bacteroidota bacterium]MDP4215381.1 histidine kinase [Bacteroidota bacterium]MDP4244525.1 histidine kinase [Bacteroidota bacterium]MDP4259941.1 histidine kinase [Bacteroidota bacterium]